MVMIILTSVHRSDERSGGKLTANVSRKNIVATARYILNFIIGRAGIYYKRIYCAVHSKTPVFLVRLCVFETLWFRLFTNHQIAKAPSSTKLNIHEIFKFLIAQGVINKGLIFSSLYCPDWTELFSFFSNREIRYFSKISPYDNL